jgi:release factor glutamine methyltransferase
VTTIGAMLDRGAASLRAAGIPDARKEARRILAHVLDVDPARLVAMEAETAPAERTAAYGPMIARRATHAPLSHVLGYRDFWEHRFRVTPDVLDPRPETETLVAAALEAPFDRLLDLGTGSGCIAVSLLAARSEATGVATDISAAALAVARANARGLGVAGRLRLVQADWAEGLSGPFDLIVSNPPYIPAADMAAAACAPGGGGVAADVRDHEPRIALTDEADGLSAYRRIAAAAPGLLRPGGRCLVEVGAGQADEVSEIFRAGGLAVAGRRADMDGRARVVVAARP